MSAPVHHLISDAKRDAVAEAQRLDNKLLKMIDLLNQAVANLERRVEFLEKETSPHNGSPGFCG